MRGLILAAVLATFGIAALAETARPEICLICQAPSPVAGELTDRLCSALRQQALLHHNLDLTVAAGPVCETSDVLLLEVRDATATQILARLVWRTAGQMRAGPMLGLDVMDKDRLPDQSLAQLAKLLITQSGFEIFQHSTAPAP